MLRLLSTRFFLLAIAMGLSSGVRTRAQETTLSTAPTTVIPSASSERLGTGVPSRLPKHEVQRPVFTIQSGGPVALPMPQFRPTRDPAPPPPVKEAKGSLPIIEQTRPWLRTGVENPSLHSAANQNVSPAARAVSARSLPPGQQGLQLTSPPLPLPRTAELPSTGQRPTLPPSAVRPQPKMLTPAASPSEAPARVLNFSIN